MRRTIELGLLLFTLGWLLIEAPSVWWREIQFVLMIMLITAWTRTTTWQHAAAAIGSGMGVAVPLMLAVGWLLRWAGIDVTDSAAGWVIVPVVEEIIKLLPVLLLSRYYQRRRLQFNLSDWLMAGCAAGAGFALIENVGLVRGGDSVLRDMARQYGPHLGGWYLIPGAWGVVGFVGHSAATGIVAAGLGLSLAIKRRGPRRRVALLAALRQIPAPWWTAAAAAFAWIALEHTLANLLVHTGSPAGRVLGNGRLTPWLALLFFALVIAVDAAHRRDALARSAMLRTQFALIRAAWRGKGVPVRVPKSVIARVFVRQSRLLNAAAWATFDV